LHATLLGVNTFLLYVHIFEYSFTAQRRASASVICAVTLRLSIHLSVRLSQVGSSTKTAICRITQTTPCSRLWTVVFWCQRSWGNFSGDCRVTPNGGAKYRRDWHWQFTISITRYLRNDAVEG